MAPGVKARESAIDYLADRSGEIPGPMVAHERAPNHPFGLGESPDGRR